MQRDAQWSFGRVLAHHLQRQRPFSGVRGDAVLPRLERRADGAHRVVWHVGVRIDDEAAVVDRLVVGREARIRRLRHRPAPEPESFEPLEDGAVDGQRAHPQAQRLLRPSTDRFVEDGVGFPTLDGAGPGWVLRRRARVVAHLASPSTDVVEREAGGRQHFVQHEVRGVAPLAAQRDPQGIALLPDVVEGRQPRLLRHRKEQLVVALDDCDSAHGHWLLERPGASERQRQDDAGVDEGDLDVVIRNFFDHVGTVAREERRSPRGAALVPQRHADLLVRPLPDPYELRSQLQHEPGPDACWWDVPASLRQHPHAPS